MDALIAQRHADALDLLAELIADKLATRGTDAAGAPAPAAAMTAEPWIAVDETAQHLGCKPQRIYDLVNDPRRSGHGCERPIPFRREGRRLLFRRCELDEWLERP